VLRLGHDRLLSNFFHFTSIILPFDAVYVVLVREMETTESQWLASVLGLLKSGPWFCSVIIHENCPVNVGKYEEVSPVYSRQSDWSVPKHRRSCSCMIAHPQFLSDLIACYSYHPPLKKDCLRALNSGMASRTVFLAGLPEIVIDMHSRWRKLFARKIHLRCNAHTSRFLQPVFRCPHRCCREANMSRFFKFIPSHSLRSIYIS
jgi:hypothetical protein